MYGVAMLDLLDRILHAQPAPPSTTVAGTAVVALGLVMYGRS
jgi:hypothetical protein